MWGLLFLAMVSSAFGAVTSGPIDSIKIRPMALPSAGRNGELRVSADNELYIYDSGWTAISGGGGGADTFLSNLTSPIGVNQHFTPGADATYTLGSSTSAWSGGWLKTNGVSIGLMIKDATTPTRTWSVERNIVMSDGTAQMGIQVSSASTGIESSGDMFLEATGDDIFYKANNHFFTGVMRPKAGNTLQIQSDTGIELAGIGGPANYVPNITNWTNIFNIYGADNSSSVNIQSRYLNLFGPVDESSVMTIQLYDLSGGEHIQILPPDTIPTPYYLILPDAQATSPGQALVNDGSGVLSWATPGGASAALDNLAAVAVNAELAAGTGTSLRLTSDTSIDLSGFGGAPNEIINISAYTNGFGIYGSMAGSTHQIRGGALDLTGPTDLSSVMSIFIRDLDANEFAELKVPDVIAANYTLTLPPDDGTPGQVLQTDGSGILSWESAGGFDPANITATLTAGTGLGLFALSDTSIELRVTGTNDSALLLDDTDGGGMLFMRTDGGYLNLDTSFNVNAGNATIETTAADSIIRFQPTSDGQIVFYDGHLSSAGGAPAVSSCGTSPSIVGNDIAGAVTVGTGGIVTSCTITFDAAYDSAPHCFVNNQTDLVATRAVASTTAVVFSVTAPFTAGAVLDYYCIQHQ